LDHRAGGLRKAGFPQQFQTRPQSGCAPMPELWNFEKARGFFTWLVSVILQSERTKNNQ